MRKLVFDKILIEIIEGVKYPWYIVSGFGVKRLRSQPIKVFAHAP